MTRMGAYDFRLRFRPLQGPGRRGEGRNASEKLQQSLIADPTAGAEKTFIVNFTGSTE